MGNRWQKRRKIGHTACFGCNKKIHSRLTLVHVIEEPSSELALLSAKRRSEIKKKNSDFLKLQVAKSRAIL